MVSVAAGGRPQVHRTDAAVTSSMERCAVLLRQGGDDQGTPGVLWSPSGGTWRSLELPWRDNVRKLSCIPEGRYECVVVNSPRFGRVYHVQGVPGRDAILIHSGNWAGAIPAWKTHVQGCILLGEKAGTLGGQRAVLVSKPAVRRFNAAMQMQPFLLEVINGS
jgi:hypothetical protein